MPKRLLELAALVVLAAVAVLFGPPWDKCVMRNDLAAYVSLLNLASAQAEFQRDKRVDLDRDGVGEFGYFAELSGVAVLPGSEGGLDEPYLTRAFRRLRPDGTVQRSGYRFRMFLPGSGGTGAGEAGTPADGSPASRGSDAVDPALAERRWCAYAWPADYGNTGAVTLFIDQEGSILCADDPRYSGDRGPEPGAAYGSGGLASISGSAPAGAAQDGNTWRPFSTR